MHCFIILDTTITNPVNARSFQGNTSPVLIIMDCWRCSRNCLAWQGFTNTNRHRPLVSSQEQRALFVPLSNRLQPACQPLIVFPYSVYIGFVFGASGKTFKRRVFDALGSTKDASLRGELFCSTLPRRPAVRPDPTRPLYVRVLDSTVSISYLCLLNFNLGALTIFLPLLCHHFDSYITILIHT